MKRNVIISGEFTMAEVSSTSQSTSSKPKKTATERIAALKAAGVDVSCYFPMGEEMIVRVKDGIPSQVTDDDPVFTRIAEGGYIAHSRLFRRWVMAQMFRMLRDMQRDGRDFTAVLQQHGYDYSWKMLEHEFLAQHKMAKHGDGAAFAERNRWFSRDVAVAMAEDYLCHIQRLIPTLREHLCRKRPYKRICGVNVFTNEIDFKFIAPIRRAIDDIRRPDNPCRRPGATLPTSVSAVNRYLYRGIGGYSWATQVLPVINVEEDIHTLNEFVLDCLRATATGKRRIGGLGYVSTQTVGCISRGRGRNVTANRAKTPLRIHGYQSLALMRNALRTSRPAYDTLVANL